jgi:diguanylate cyclase (GGDEF)-like protein/PAS domain S-box-containing protein
MFTESADSLLPSGFMPHGYCFLWQPSLLWLHVASDLLIVAAYYSIPFALWALVKKRGDLEFDWMLRLFALFIFLCGTTHLVGVWTTWVPDYWLAGLVKLATALVSLVTAVLVWPLLPRLVALPSPSQLLEINGELAEVLEQHRQAEAQLRKLSMAVEHSSSMVIVTDTEGRIEYCNPAFCQCSGYEEPEILGQRVSILRSGFTDPSVYQDLWRTLSQGQSWQGEFLDRRKSGDLYWSMVYIAPVRAEGDGVSHYVAVSHDISELKNSEETIRRLAFYDPLTELPNRALFKERLEQTLLRARRDRGMFALMYLDLDRFKNINDTLGHIVGDRLLIEVGRRLRQQLRGTDTVARLGGDEFAVILGELWTAEFAATVGKSLCEAMSAPFSVDGHELFVSASIGISLYPDDHTEIEQLIRMADSALYAAKDLGRDQFAYYSEIANPLSPERLALERDLRYAAERGELSVEYQPKVDLADGRLIAVEALLRWRHPRCGWIAPERFIAVAEETGLIAPLGEWMLRAVCRQVKEWRQAGFDWPVAVNLSARQFRSRDLLATVDAILEEAGVVPGQLEFELTESTVMDNPEQTAGILNGMRARGFRLAIDDFGTGYSSLSLLKRFRVDALKIDRAFVCGIESDPDDISIVRAVIALAHSLGLQVVAEGVETLAQREFLRREGCNQAQGYYFSRPLPPGEVLARFHDAEALGRSPVWICPVACG